MFITVVGSALAEPPEFIIQRIGIEQGLSQSNVYSILRDSHGFMWFGTGDGLDRYDGFGFAHFRHRPRDSSSLPGSAIRVLAEDSLGNIWIGTGDVGAAMMNRRSGRVRFFRNNPHDSSSISSNAITTIVVDRTGIVWVGTSTGLDRIDPRTSRVERFIDFGILPYQFSGVTSLRMNRFGELAVTGFHTPRDTLCTINPHTRKITPFIYAGDLENLRCVGENPSGEFMLEGTSGRQSRYVNIPREGSRNNIGNALRPGISGVLDLAHMIASIDEDFVFARLFEFGHGVGGIIAHRTGFDADGYLKLDSPGFNIPDIKGRIISFQPGQKGMYWVGTSNGVYRLVARDHRFSQALIPPFGLAFPKDKPSLATRIRSIQLDRTGDLWIGTDDALYRRHDPRGWGIYRSDPKQLDGMINSTINVIYEESDGRLLVGTNAGVLAYDRGRDRFRSAYNASDNPTSRFPHNIWSMVRDTAKNFWVGSLATGLFEFDGDGHLRQQFLPDTAKPGSISNSNVWSLLVDHTGSLWVGTAGGLDRWNPATRTFLHYRYSAANHRSLPGDNIWWLHEDEQGRLWIGAYGGGIARYDRATDDFTSFTTQEGLPNDGVYTIQSIGSELWIGSNAGLTRFDTRSGGMRSYDSSDGLQSNEFTYKASFKGNNGELFFGGIRGVNSFRPDQLQGNPTPPALAVTSFRLVDSVISEELFDGDSVECDYAANRISFEIAALDFINPAKNQYSYKLEDYDNKWSSPGSRRYVSYTGLPPGDYILLVRGSNSDGVWNMKGMRILIRVIPPFWLTLWFKGLLALVALGALAFALFVYRRSLRRKETQKRKVLESQLQGLRSQMNPHFIFNSLNAIQNFIVSNAGDSAAQYLAKFARLMRMVLEHSQHPTIPVVDEIAFLKHYLDLEGLRFEHRFESVIEVDPTMNVHEQHIPSMLVQPYVENAVRHGLLPFKGAGRLTVRFISEKDGIACTIEDNGVGREASRTLRGERSTHQSIGMSLTNERLDLLNSLRNRPMRVSIEDLFDATTGAPSGTRVTIHIPSET